MKSKEVDVWKWLIKLVKGLNIIKIVKKPIPPSNLSNSSNSSNSSNPPNYLVICPYCKSVCTFSWAKTDIRGYQEEVGCWVCKCKKTPLGSPVCSGGLFGVRGF